MLFGSVRVRACGVYETYLLLLLGQLIPPLVHLGLNSILLNLLTRREGSLKIGLDDRTRMLVVQERSSQRLLGGIGVLLLLLALALLALVGFGSGGDVVGRVDDLVDAAGRSRSRVHGSTGSGSDGAGDLQLVEIAVFAGQDGVGVLHVCAQEVVEAILDVGEAALEVAEGDDDLVVMLVTASGFRAMAVVARALT